MRTNQDIDINIIVATAKQSRVIGTIDGKIPWHIKEDLLHFKETTTGFPIVMGRKTFESFGGRILPNRHHVIITRQKDYVLPVNLQGNPAISIVSNLEAGISIATKKAIEDGKREIFIVGGGEIYKMAMSFAKNLYITLVEKKDGTKISGNVFFPEYKKIFKKVVSCRENSNEEYNFEFLLLEK